MSLTVQNLRAVGPGVEPASLLPGQICFNVTDKILFTGDGSDFKTSFDGTVIPGVPGAGWFSTPLDFSQFSTNFIVNPEVYGDVPTDGQVLTWDSTLGHTIWTNSGATGNSVYLTTNANVAAAPGATLTAKINTAIGVVSPDPNDWVVVTGLPGDVFQGLYFFDTSWVKASNYAFPDADQVPYSNTVSGLTANDVQEAIDELDTLTAAAQGTADAAFAAAGIAQDAADAAQADATQALADAAAAQSTADAALPRAGGTMTGTLNALTVNTQQVNVGSGYGVTFVGDGSIFGISGVVNSTSTTIAASLVGVKTAYDVATAALARSGGTMTGTIVFAAGQTFPISGIDIASGTQLGVVQVGSYLNITAGGVLSANVATTSAAGVVQVGNHLTVSGSGLLDVRDATTMQAGAVQLVDALNSSSDTQALTANQGRVLQGQINALTISGSIILAGSINASNGLIQTVTTQGAVAGFVVGSTLPAPAPDPSPPGNNNYYVIVTAPGTFTPPGGGGAITSENGDWILSNGTIWQELEVGSRPAYASTTTPGIIQLATVANTIAGVDGLLGVTPVSLQGKLSDSVSTTCSLLIASSTAVKTAYDIGNAALPLTGGTMTGNITFQDAGEGVVFNGGSQLFAISDSTSTTSSTTAASSTAVKSAYDLANAALPKAGGTMTGNLTFSGAGFGIVFNDASTIEAISDSTSTTSSITAASSTAVKSAYDLANAALARSGGTMTGAITFVAGQTFPITGIQDATTGQKGVVQIGSNIQVSSGTISVNTATTSQLGLVQVGANVDVASGVISVKSASTSQSGVVQLNDTATSTSITEALTANQGKLLQDQINALSTSNNLTFAGTIDGSTGLMLTVTTEGAGVGFTVGEVMPTPSSTVNEYFTIISVAGTMTPPGGASTTTYVGDWWLASSTAYTYIAAGFQPPYASTTTPGLVRLSTNAETQAGTDATEAVTPASLQSKVSDSTSTTSSIAIASSTAVKSAYDLANAAVPKTCYTALGALVTGTGVGTIGTVSIGSTGQFLAANTGCSGGVEWCTLSLACVPCAAYTAVGNILVGTGVATFSALPLGTSGQALVVDTACTSGVKWVTATGLNLVGFTCSAMPFNTAFGSLAGAAFTANSVANTAIGYAALDAETSGDFNVALGHNALTAQNGASGNIAIGGNAGAQVTNGSNNVLIGCNAGDAITTGTDNIAIGSNAGGSQSTSVQSVFIGTGAGQSANAGGVTLVGFCAGQALTTSGCVTYLGFVAGRNATGLNNTYVGALTGCAASNASACGTLLGFCAGSALTTGNGNALIGFNAGRLVTTGGFNVALGTAALQTSTTGSSNVAIGCGALAGISTTSGNTALGHRAGLNATGSNNVVLGCDAGNQLSTGSTNVFVGNTAGDAVTTGSNNTIIGDIAGSAALAGEAIIAAGTTIKFQANSSGAWSPDGTNFGTAGQTLQSNGTAAVPTWVTPQTVSTTATKATTSGTPIDLLSWTGAVRMGTLTVLATDNATNVAWGNITIASDTGAGSSIVTTSGGTFGTFDVISGGGGETIVQFTPSATLATVNFVYKYTVSFGAQPTVL